MIAYRDGELGAICDGCFAWLKESPQPRQHEGRTVHVCGEGCLQHIKPPRRPAPPE